MGYGCYGGAGYGCCGSMGYGCYGGVGSGCCGGGVVYGCYGGAPQGCYGGVVQPPPQPYPPLPHPTKDGKKGEDEDGKRIEEKKDKKDKDKDKDDIAAPATLIVHVPAGAQLTIGSQPSQQTSTRRAFITPTLEPGKVYSYTLTAEVTRNGQPTRWQETVSVRAGQATEVTLTMPVAGVAAR
jgi:uncharacterized protein (TIGR03000 family)